MNTVWENFRRLQRFQGILYVVIGLFLLINPSEFFQLVSYILGFYFIFLGIMGFLQVKRNSGSLFPNVILILIGLGILVLLSPLVKFASVIFGLFVFFSGLEKLLQGLRIRQRIINDGSTLIIMGIVLGLLGLIIIFNPFQSFLLLFRVAGLIFLLVGLYNVFNSKI